MHCIVIDDVKVSAGLSPLVCSCSSGFLGQRCECNAGNQDERRLKAACRRDNGTECSGLGDCVCGVCNCHSSQDGRIIYGTYCECDDRSCELDQNRPCGGSPVLHINVHQQQQPQRCSVLAGSSVQALGCGEWMSPAVWYCASVTVASSSVGPCTPGDGSHKGSVG